MSFIRPLACMLGLGFILGPGFGHDASAGDDPTRPSGVAVPSDPVFSALLTDGTTIPGRVRKLGDDGLTLAPDRGNDRTVPLDRLVKLTREGASPEALAEGGREVVLFPDGDRIMRCKVGKAGDFNLEVHSGTLDDVAVSLDGILALIFNPPIDPASAEALIARVRTEPRDAEVAWLANGDKLPGQFAGLDEKKLTFLAPAGKLELPRVDSGILAVGFAQGQVAYRRPAGPFLEFTLLDGSKLGVTKTRVEGGKVVGTARFGAEVRLPIGELATVHALNGSVAYLADRETVGAIYEPYVGPSRAYRRNATVAGEILRVGGREYDRGLGTQSRTLLVYKLEPGARRFQATIGLDDRAGPLGSVIFKVRVDRSFRYESPPMTAGETPRTIDIDVAGASALVLMTEFGDRGDIQDHADWIEARIIR